MLSGLVCCDVSGVCMIPDACITQYSQVFEMHMEDKKMLWRAHEQISEAPDSADQVKSVASLDVKVTHSVQIPP